MSSTLSAVVAVSSNSPDVFSCNVTLSTGFGSLHGTDATALAHLGVSVAYSRVFGSSFLCDQPGCIDNTLLCYAVVATVLAYRSDLVDRKCLHSSGERSAYTVGPCARPCGT